MQIVTVNHLSAIRENGHLAVTFKRFPYCVAVTLIYRQQDVRSLEPLTIKLTIPPRARINDMHIFEGCEVCLVLARPKLNVIQSE
jgi:hypothetical protein